MSESEKRRGKREIQSYESKSKNKDTQEIGGRRRGKARPTNHVIASHTGGRIFAFGSEENIEIEWVAACL